MLNDIKKSNYINIKELTKYMNNDQIDYIYPDYYEIKYFNEDPFVTLGFEKTKDIFTPEDFYKYNKYGSVGLNLKNNLDVDIFFDDISFGDI